MKCRWGFLTFCLLLTSLAGQVALAEGEVNIRDALTQAQKRHDQVAVELYNLRHQELRMDQDGHVQLFDAGPIPDLKGGIQDSKDLAKDKKNQAGNFFTRNLFGSKADRQEKKRAHQEAQAYRQSSEVQTKARADLKKKEARLIEEEAALNADLIKLNDLERKLCTASPAHCKISQSKLSKPLQGLLTRSTASAARAGYAPIPAATFTHSADEAAAECQRKHLYPPDQTAHSFEGFGELSKLSDAELQAHEGIQDRDLKEVVELGAILNDRFERPNSFVSAMARAAYQAALYNGEDGEKRDDTRYRVFRNYAICVYDVLAPLVSRYGNHDGGACEVPRRNFASLESRANDHLSLAQQMSSAFGPEHPREERPAPLARTLNTQQLDAAHDSLPTLVNSFRQLYTSNPDLQDALRTKNLSGHADLLMNANSAPEALFALHHLNNEPGFRRAVVDLPDSPATTRRAKQALLASLKKVGPAIPALSEHHGIHLAPQAQRMQTNSVGFNGSNNASSLNLGSFIDDEFFPFEPFLFGDHQSPENSSVLASGSSLSSRTHSENKDDKKRASKTNGPRLQPNPEQPTPAEKNKNKNTPQNSSEEKEPKPPVQKSGANSPESETKAYSGFISDFINANPEKKWPQLTEANKNAAHDLIDSMAGRHTRGNLTTDDRELLAAAKDRTKSVADRITALDKLRNKGLLDGGSLGSYDYKDHTDKTTTRTLTETEMEYKELRRIFRKNSSSVPPVQKPNETVQSPRKEPGVVRQENSKGKSEQSKSSSQDGSKKTDKSNQGQTDVRKLLNLTQAGLKEDDTSSDHSTSSSQTSSSSNLSSNARSNQARTNPSSSDSASKKPVSKPHIPPSQSSSNLISNAGSALSEDDSESEENPFPLEYKKAHRRNAARFEAAYRLLNEYKFDGITEQQEKEIIDLIKQHNQLADKEAKPTAEEQKQLSELSNRINQHRAMAVIKNDDEWKQYRDEVWKELDEEKNKRKPLSKPASAVRKKYPKAAEGLQDLDFSVSDSKLNSSIESRKESSRSKDKTAESKKTPSTTQVTQEGVVSGSTNSPRSSTSSNSSSEGEPDSSTNDKDKEALRRAQAKSAKALLDKPRGLDAAQAPALQTTKTDAAAKGGGLKSNANESNKASPPAQVTGKDRVPGSADSSTNKQEEQVREPKESKSVIIGHDQRYISDSIPENSRFNLTQENEQLAHSLVTKIANSDAITRSPEQSKKVAIARDEKQPILVRVRALDFLLKHNVLSPTPKQSQANTYKELQRVVNNSLPKQQTATLSNSSSEGDLDSSTKEKDIKAPPKSATQLLNRQTTSSGAARDAGDVTSKKEKEEEADSGKEVPAPRQLTPPNSTQPKTKPNEIGDASTIVTPIVFGEEEPVQPPPRLNKR